ncbi:MAG: hypothetical protein IKU86_08325 [Thermoguttaceae bacterium]|nr:hypothetical protein [Thermoguttaceae bacterium]
MSTISRASLAASDALLDAVESSATSDASFFPAPLAVFEEYMFLDDSPRFPTAIVSRLRFSGKLDVERWRRALELAIRRHPFFACRVEKTGRRFSWTPADSPLSFVEARRETLRDADGDAFFENARPLRLDREPGLRATVVWDDDSADVVLRCHHAATDGLGLDAFIGDALVEYAASIGALPQDVRRRPLDFDALRRRGQFGLTLKSYVLNYLHTTATTFRFFFGRARAFDPLADAPDETPLDADVDAILRRSDLLTTALSADETRRCFATAKRLGVTVNDLTLSAFVWALDEIRRSRGEKIGGTTRIATPINMRAAARSAAPACNVVTMTFVDVPRFARRTPSRLLQATRRRMNVVKRRDQKHFLDLVLKSGRFIAGLLGRDLSLFLNANRCQATATFSNIGRALVDVPLERTDDGRLRVGDLVLDKIEIAPPIRKRSPISVAALTYGERLTLGFRFDPSCLTEPEARRFLADFAAACADYFETTAKTA